MPFEGSVSRDVVLRRADFLKIALIIIIIICIVPSKCPKTDSYSEALRVKDSTEGIEKGRERGAKYEIKESCFEAMIRSTAECQRHLGKGVP